MVNSYSTESQYHVYMCVGVGVAMVRFLWGINNQVAK